MRRQGMAGSAYYLYFDVVAPSWYSWVVVLGVSTTALLPALCFRVLLRTLAPADHMIAQEVHTTPPPPCLNSPQRKEARPLSHALTSDKYNFLTARLCGLMVRRWRLIGYFHILYSPRVSALFLGQTTVD
jgi:hypothetical protein